jgi:hypothetical protein
MSSIYDLDPVPAGDTDSGPSISAAPTTDGAAGLTPAQRRAFDDLLEIGAARPLMPQGLPERLAEHLRAGTAATCETWTERSVYLTKSTIATVLRCEGQAAADAHTPRGGTRTLIPSVVVGQVAHVAIQLSYTHPGQSAHVYVEEALNAQIAREPGFAESWHSAGMVGQSDLRTQMVSRTTAFLDSFPPLRPEWSPRFEESMQARVGKLTLAARPDLVLGRPKPEMTQTMLVADFKTGSLRDDHAEEAAFYALVSTLRHGVAPYKAFIYSLTSTDHSTPEYVTEEVLFAAADRVIRATNAYVEVLTESRDAELAPGQWCNWCPLSLTCPVSARREAVTE